MGALAEALAQEPQGRLAGSVLITDGRVHDLPAAPALPAPLHTLLTGREGDWDRRLVVKNAPAFGILDEEITLTVRVEDQGEAPGDEIVPLSIAVDGGPPMQFEVPLGEDMDLPLVLPHAGMNILQFETPEAPGELTDHNNAAVVQINGVRDRLRVLLVSGEPHPGERTWRNLLKSTPRGPRHFTILRPPEKQDGVPVEELSLIAFPTYELFVEKLDDFDLVIFDRYRGRGSCPTNTSRTSPTTWRAAGGSGRGRPRNMRAPSRSSQPAGRGPAGAPTPVLEEGFTPLLSELGQRHPVTRGWRASRPAPAAEDGTPGWGRWFRLIDVTPHARGRQRHGGPRGPPAPPPAARGRGARGLLARPRLALGPRLRGRRGRNLSCYAASPHWLNEGARARGGGALGRACRARPCASSAARSARSPEVTITAPTAPRRGDAEAGLAGRFELLWEAPRSASTAHRRARRRR
jgi:hypothetical protein